MGKRLLAGLFTVLLGASSLNSCKDAPKEKLEDITNQNSYMGPDKNYSFRLDPKVKEFYCESHKLTPNDGFEDVYSMSSAADSPILFIARTEGSGDLYAIADTALKYSIKNFTDRAPKIGQFGQPISIRHKIVKSEKTTVDSYPAIRKVVDFKVVDKITRSSLENIPDLKEYLLTRNPKTEFFVTFVQYEKDIYTLTYCYIRYNREDANKAKKTYNDFMDDFHALKK